MDKLKEIVAGIKTHIEEIESEIATAETKGFVYARAKNIRKAAQEIKVAAQDLRTATSDEFKAKAE